MKVDIHPDYVETQVTCSCGNAFTTRSTVGELHVELCAECHPFYTGKQKLVDTGGRVERFKRRYAGHEKAKADAEAEARAAREAGAVAEAEASEGQSADAEAKAAADVEASEGDSAEPDAEKKPDAVPE